MTPHELDSGTCAREGTGHHGDEDHVLIRSLATYIVLALALVGLITLLPGILWAATSLIGLVVGLVGAVLALVAGLVSAAFGLITALITGLLAVIAALLQLLCAPPIMVGILVLAFILAQRPPRPGV